jgi:hypothetical protein
MFEDPTRSAEQRDSKAELLIFCLAFYIGDAPLALVLAEGDNIQSGQVGKCKGVSQESEYEF